MAGAKIYIAGGYDGNGTNALYVPSNLDASTASFVQAYLNALSAAFTAIPNILNLDNFDITTGHENWLDTGAAATLEELTNTDSIGNVSAGIVTTGIYVAKPLSQDLILEAPGTCTVRGAAATAFALIGADSNVHYSVVDPDAGSIDAAGGSNLINIDYDGQGTTNNETINSAGHDYLNLYGAGQDVVNVESGADDTVAMFAGVSTVTAGGNATVSVIFLEQAGGNLDFINNATTAQTVFSGAYTQSGGANVYAPNAVTAFGGAGGGFYAGGKSGSNSLVGGAGDVTLLGAGGSDFLSASGGSNVLEAGNGLESLLAGAGTSQNSIEMGVPNAGQSVVASGIASSDGAGTQYFIIGNTVGETITGSTVAGAFNYYAVVCDSTTGGSTFTITDFGSSNGTIYLTDSSDFYAGNAVIAAIAPDPFSLGNAPAGNTTLIQLTDGTVITLQGVTPSLVGYTNPSGTTAASIYLT
jgi:hypothetical protein